MAAPWFTTYTTVVLGSPRNDKRALVPLQYDGPDVFTDVEIVVLDGENTVTFNPEPEVHHMRELAPGDKVLLEFPLVQRDGPRYLWVPNRSSMSCDLGIFVDQSAEPVAASEPKVG